MKINKIYLIVALVTVSIIALYVMLVKNIKIGEIVPLGVTSYGSLELDWNPQGITCYDPTNERIELDYSSISSNTDFSKGYLTLKADEGLVSDIDCASIDSQFIEIRLGSPSEVFENLGFTDYELKEDESVTLEFYVTVVSGLSWTADTTKDITISVSASNCDTTVGEGSCDFVNTLDFYNTATVSCP